jgi:hypothetical protein
MPRSRDGRSLTSLSSILSSPCEIVSSPAIILRIVDLPQPEGPTSTTKVPSSISRSTPLMATYSP